MTTPRIVGRRPVFRTPWFELVAKSVRGAADPRPHFAIQAPDYVSVLAIAPGRRVVLVRQYRPAVEKYTIELPSGHVEKGQTPLAAARMELLEETGYRGSMSFVGSLQTDAGRFTNRTWCFYAHNLRRVRGWKAEPSIEVVEQPLARFLKDVRGGKFDQALNLATASLVIFKKGIR